MSSPQLSSLIESVHVYFSYDGLDDALSDVSFQISAGERICILGRNGSGKSTLARCLNAIIIPDEGRVFVNNLPTDELDNLVEIRRNVGMVFQNPDDQMVTSIVEDDVAFGPENLGIPRDEMIKRVESSLEAVSMLESRQASPSELSGGQKQRIAIAGVLAMLPNIIVFDEATAMLDPEGKHEVMEQMDALSQQGYTIIHVTHDMNDALLADRIIILSHGFIAYDGPSNQAFNDAAFIQQLGLEEPFALKLSSNLAKRGIPLKETCHESEVLEALCPSFTSK